MKLTKEMLYGKKVCTNEYQVLLQLFPHELAMGGIEVNEENLKKIQEHKLNAHWFAMNFFTGKARTYYRDMILEVILECVKMQEAADNGK
jgi:hypothetical protein